MRPLFSVIAAGYSAETYELARAEENKPDTGEVSLAAERTRGSVRSHRDWPAADSTRIRHRHQ